MRTMRDWKAIESTRLGQEYDPTDNSLVWSNECRLIYNFPADEEIDLATD